MTPQVIAACEAHFAADGAVIFLRGAMKDRGITGESFSTVTTIPFRRDFHA